MLNSGYLFDAFLTSAHKFHDKTALLAEHAGGLNHISYAQIISRAIGLSSLISSEFGIKSGDKVAILLENRPEFAWTLMAVWYLGAVAVPLDIQLPPDDRTRCLVHSEAQLVITSSRIKHLAGDTTAGIPWLAVDQIPDSKPVHSHRQPRQAGRHSLAALFYTSGTTGEPKAVMLTHTNLLANLRSIDQLKIAEADDIIVSILPLHHTYAFTTTLLYPLLIGASIVYPPSLASAEIIATIKRAEATILVGVPQVFNHLHAAIASTISGLPVIKRQGVTTAALLCQASRRLLKRNPGKRLFAAMHERVGTSLRLMISGGARLDPQIAQDFYGWGFTLIEGYGLTETSPVVSFALADDARFGSVGRPLPGVEVTVRNPDSDGEGEIAIRGANVMAGYFKMPRETARVVIDGWFHTGDKGRIDKDGFIYLNGRTNDLIVLANGKNINPEEVEAVYAKNPFVQDIAVLPLRQRSPKGINQERLVAIVLPNFTHFMAEQELNIHKRLRWEFENISVHLPTYKRITGFAIAREPLPRTRLGKLQRFHLVDLYRQLGTPKTTEVEEGEASPKGSELAQLTIAYISRELGRPVSTHDHLELDLGLDSLGRMELLLGLKDHLSLTLSDEQAIQFFVCTRIQELVAKLQEFAASRPDGIAIDENGLIISDIDPTKNFAILAERAKSLLREILNRPAVYEEDHLELDLGLDSLGRMEVLLSLQDRLGLIMDDSIAFDFFMTSTVGDLLTKLHDALPHMQAAPSPSVTLWSDILQQPAHPALAERIQPGTHHPWARAVTWIAHTLSWLYFRLFHGLTVTGVDHLSNHKEGEPLLICPNHVSFYDPLLILAALPVSFLTKTFFLGDSKFLDHFLLRPFQRVMRLIPLNFTYTMIDALKICAHVLRKNQYLCYFPEGQRSIDGDLKEFRKGIGVLVKEVTSPVLPVYIDGAFQAWPRGQRFPALGKRIRVHIGTAVPAAALMGHDIRPGQDYQSIADNIRNKISELQPR